MSTRARPSLVTFFTASAALLLLSGCATTKSTRAEPLESTVDIADVADCRAITVSAFTVTAENDKATEEVAAAFAADITKRLASDFGNLFDSVESAPDARGVPGECILGGTISRYDPGNRAVRLATLPGIGSVHFEGSIKLTDAVRGQELLAAPFDKLWAFSGVIGASKGIQNLVNETAAAAAATVAQGKGWKPPAASTR